jgi:rhodanese-related sulfurtransferase
MATFKILQIFRITSYLSETNALYRKEKPMKYLLPVFSLLWLMVSLGSFAAISVEKQTLPADTITVQDLQSRIHSGVALQLLDVRLVKDRDTDQRLLPGAIWHDPAQVDIWAKTLTKKTPVVVYCVHGHRVSQEVRNRLAQLGFSVQQLAGGIEAWKAVGGATVPFH